MKPPIVVEDDAARREEDAQRQRGRERMLELWRGAVATAMTAARAHAETRRSPAEPVAEEPVATWAPPTKRDEPC